MATLEKNQFDFAAALLAPDQPNDRLVALATRAPVSGHPGGLAFRVACIPPTTTHQAKRIVRIHKFGRLADKPELLAAKGMLDAVLLPFQPAAPITGAVELRLEFVWPWRKGEPKRNRAAGRRYHTSRPDTSNIAKTLEDRLVALRFIGDDKAVARSVVTKYWGEMPGIAVTITQLEP